MKSLIRQSHWQLKTIEQAEIFDTNIPKKTDALIVGGGIMGISTAYWLSKFGMDVVLLEQASLAQQASGQNAGIVTFGPEEEYVLAVKTIGRQNAKRILEDTMSNQHILEKLIADEKMKIEYIKTGFMSLACTRQQLRVLAESADLMASDGLTVSLADRSQIEELLGVTLNTRFVGGTYSLTDSLLNPVAYTCQLGSLAQKCGAKIIRNQAVKAFFYAEGFWHVILTQCSVVARNLILATGSASSNLIDDLKEFIFGVRETVISARVSHGRCDMKMGWAGNNVSEYGRKVDESVVLLGGISRKHKLENKTLPELQNILNTYVERTFAKVSLEIINAWTGIISDSIDHVPIVGEHPGKKGLWYITAFGGQGLAFSQLMPSMLSKAIIENDAQIIPSYAHPARFLQSLRQA